MLGADQYLPDNLGLDSRYGAGSIMQLNSFLGVIHAFCVISDYDRKTDGGYDEERAAAANAQPAAEPQVVVVNATAEPAAEEAAAAK